MCRHHSDVRQDNSVVSPPPPRGTRSPRRARSQPQSKQGVVEAVKMGRPSQGSVRRWMSASPTHKMLNKSGYYFIDFPQTSARRRKIEATHENNVSNIGSWVCKQQMQKYSGSPRRRQFRRAIHHHTSPRLLSCYY